MGRLIRRSPGGAAAVMFSRAGAAVGSSEPRLKAGDWPRHHCAAAVGGGGGCGPPGPVTQSMPTPPNLLIHQGRRSRRGTRGFPRSWSSALKTTWMGLVPRSSSVELYNDVETRRSGEVPSAVDAELTSAGPTHQGMHHLLSHHLQLNPPLQWKWLTRRKVLEACHGENKCHTAKEKGAFLETKQEPIPQLLPGRIGVSKKQDEIASQHISGRSAGGNNRTGGSVSWHGGFEGRTGGFECRTEGFESRTGGAEAEHKQHGSFCILHDGDRGDR